MAEKRRIYLDNAATSWPKPAAVYDAVEHYLREIGSPAGRGGYRAAEDAERIVAGCRKDVASLFGIADPRNVAFTFNGTDALNIAIQGALSPGDHVVTTLAEHNSVLRPLRFLEENASITVTRVPVDEFGVFDPTAVQAAVREETRLVVVTHASNVTGVVQPVEEVGALLSASDALLLVDAAQTAGHLPCNLIKLGADMIASPGHKGLLGPLGTGVLVLGEGVADRLRSFRYGGTGTQSEDDRQPVTMPEKLEAGNLNLPGIAGLRAGISYLAEQGIESLHQQTMLLRERLVAGLAPIQGVTILGPTADLSAALPTVGVLSMTVDGYDPQEVAAMLDSAYGIEVRSGLHCAPEIHRSLGTFPTGTVRFSVGSFSTEQDIDIAIQAVTEISAAAMSV